MLKFELNIEDRKTLAKRMEALTGIHPYYTRAPLYAYDIGCYTIDREGNLLVEAENADPEVLSTLLNEGLICGGEEVSNLEAASMVLDTAGPVEGVEQAHSNVTVIPAAQTEDNVQRETAAAGDLAPDVEHGQEEEEDVDVHEDDETAIEEVANNEEETTHGEPEIPMDMNFDLPIGKHTGVSLRNLVNLVYSRGPLISKATGGIFRVDEELVEALKDDTCTFTVANFLKTLEDYTGQHGSGMEGLVITKDAVSFQGFPVAPDMEHLTAYGQLAVLMNNQAITQKRIQAKEVNDSNEKYALRIWLLRLGMNGSEFKQTRKILMENLGGHTAFRTPEEAQRAKEKAQQKRDALKAAKEAAAGKEPTESSMEDEAHLEGDDQNGNL